MRLTLPLALYAGVTRLIEPWLPGLVQRRLKRGKEDPARFGERLGHATLPRPDGVLAWLHGASVGESLSLLPLAQTLRTARPDVAILVTSGTVTSAQLLAQRLPAGVIHQFAPLDGPTAVARFLAHWRPDLGVLVESELWPNLLIQARRRGAGLALVSAKLSESTFNNWRRLPRSARVLLRTFDLILAQDARAAERLTALGAWVQGVADLKFGAAPLPADKAQLAALTAQIGARPLILAASTHPGEDELILDAFAPLAPSPHRPLLVVVPRHPERGAAIADLARARPLTVTRAGAGEAPGDASVHIADSLGELGLWFRLARLAIIGGGFVPGVGGHNPLEPARLGCPLISGPMIENWTTAYGDLLEAKGGAVIEPIDLTAWIRRAILKDPGLLAQAARAQVFVEARDVEARAAPARVLDLLP